MEGGEVPERVVRRLSLRDLPVRMRFPGVNDVGELDGILDEEHRDVIADEIVDAFGRVELGGEPPSVSDSVGRAP